MNKLYISAMAFAVVGGSVSAQLAQNATFGLTKLHTAADNERASAYARPTASAVENRAVFWTEDFSGGAIPAGWTNVDELTPQNETPVTFVWSNNPDDVAPSALGYVASANFNTPGASNGYLWSDSDRGLPVAPSTESLTKLTTAAINCSGQPTVQFTMKSLIGVFANDANQFVKLRVSTDLENWTDFFPFPCLISGAAAPPCVRWSANPQDVLINITSAAANQPVVYLQFEWLGNWEYFWAIDDLQLSSLPENEIKMNFGYVSSTGLGEEYGRIPNALLPATMNVGAQVWNFGGTDQTNVVVSYEITNAGGTVILNGQTNVGTILQGDTVTTDEDAALPPGLANDLYTVTFEVTSDQTALDEDPSDNVRVRTFEVTSSLYSLDNLGQHGPVQEVTSQVGSGSFLDNSENVKFMVMYDFIDQFEATGIQIALGPATSPGSSIIVSILDTADVLATTSVVNLPLAESDQYTITQEDIDAGVVGIPFLEPISLDPNSYYAVASLFADGTNDVFLLDDATVPQPALASVLWIPIDDQNQNLYGGNGVAWAVRLTSVLNVAVNSNVELEGITTYPNPTNGVLNISTSQTGKLLVEVMNIVGELVMTTNFTGVAALDMSTYADGVYTVRISDGTKSTVKRITLN